MNTRECSCCHEVKPETSEFYSLDGAGYRKQCRACKNTSGKRARERAAKSYERRQVVKVDSAMLGAAMDAWGGPVNREQPMRWSVAA